MRATWLFFDMGSTIMNETPAMEKRIRDTIAGTDVTYEAFAVKMAEFREMGVREDLAAFDYFGITERTPWPRDTESTIKPGILSDSAAMILQADIAVTSSISLRAS